MGKIECKLCSTAIRTDVVIPATGNHNWDTAWTQGESGHYHKCLTTGCTAKNGEQAHTTGELIVDTAPGCITNGVGHKECTECGKIVQSDVAIPSTGEHAYTVEVAGTKTPATCTSTGSVTMKCKDCTETQQKTLEKRLTQ